MSWSCSLVLVEEFSAASCVDTDACARLRLIRTADKSLWLGKKMVPSRRSQSGMTSEPSTASLGVERWMSSLEASPVSRSQSQGNEPDETTSETCSRKLLELFAKYNQDSRSWKTCQDFFPQTISGRSSLRWPTSGIAQNGLLYRLVALERTSAARGCGSLPIVPRPAACDGKGSGRIRHERSQGMNLRDWFTMNYRFVSPPVMVNEYLMGFPIGLTGLEPLETHRFQSWLQLHGGC